MSIWRWFRRLFGRKATVIPSLNPAQTPKEHSLHEDLKPGWRIQGGVNRYLIWFVVETPDGRRFLFPYDSKVITGIHSDVIKMSTGSMAELPPAKEKA